MNKTFKCAGPSCPGLAWKASDMPHPASCNSLGPSNDDSDAVRVEMRAAELEETDHWEPDNVSTMERWGFEDAETPGADPDESQHVDSPQWLAGWLSLEIERFDDRDKRDADAWAWDISRPLAEQFAETAADAADDWQCPAQSNECEIRRKCTNKCGALDQRRSEIAAETDAGCCPSCESPHPQLHPAIAHEGDVCTDAFHSRVTPENTPDRIRANGLTPTSDGAP